MVYKRSKIFQYYIGKYVVNFNRQIARPLHEISCSDIRVNNKAYSNSYKINATIKILNQILIF